ncbi:MAG: class I SAM-dependent methyltransferase [Acidobacteria bacterium]|nr:class I SAM-dependent methyltransferase [Acidobacteriota bacterium]
MNPEEYYRMRAAEEIHWWYRTLRRRVWDRLKPLLENSNQSLYRVLDAGCGTGGILRYLRVQDPQRLRLVGFDPSELALRLCGPGFLLAQADTVRLPYRSACFDAVLSLDVLCHRSIADDREALREFQRVMKPGAVLLLNLPAHPWLMSSHDAAVHTARRYTSSGVFRKLSEAGLEVQELVSWNSFLFPAAVLLRFWRRHRPPHGSDVGEVPASINHILAGLLELERRISRFIPFPSGLSLMAVARNRNHP